ncbi:sigma factor-like helix-turn-helix DNA-binding protein [Streptomyces sp. NPDC000594]|uniref:sigma factor-like helix-turn-helix DNA-binding protein n=1 Tax=Streptomyces sp. NPDC000594 TaxID=3154261 RepID=UPI0033261A18
MTQSRPDSAADRPLPSPKERRRLREARSLSEQEVASALGVTRATVRAWETGRSDPRGRRRAAYARLLESPGTTPGTAPEAASAEAPGTAPEAAAVLVPEAASGAVKESEAESRATRDPMTDAPPAPAQKQASEPDVPAATPVPVPEVESVTEAGPGPEAEPVPDAPDRVAVPAGRPTPEEVFDALYDHSAVPLVRQAYLLTGRQRLSHESVERAFRLAWQHWPEVARDGDPAGWVRAAAYEFAMSPWQRLRPAHRHPDTPELAGEAAALLAALLSLPPAYRRTLLLYDGLGLDLPETAAETEASTPATANRVLHAREAIAEQLPGLSSPDALHQRLTELADAFPAPEPTPAPSVREGSERHVWLWTRSTLTVTALIIGATGFTLLTAPQQYEPGVPAGRPVLGVPAHAGPQRLSQEDELLRNRLRAEVTGGPGRLAPQPR